jgi:hypothetical protein
MSVRWLTGVLDVNRGAAMVQSGLLLSLLLFSRFLGVTWRRQSFGIALGLAVLTSANFAIYALRAEFTGTAAAIFLNLLLVGTDFASVSIWIAYSWAPASITGGPDDTGGPHDMGVPPDEVDTWNTELGHLLRD